MLLSVTIGCGDNKTTYIDNTTIAIPMETDLQTECREYLEIGPPAHMKNYVPESLTEIVIAHGAKDESIDPELAEIGGIILLESSALDEIEDLEIRKYMKRGAELVGRVLEANR